MTNVPSAPKPRALVLMPHGRLLDLNDPDPTSWRDEDLARGLARTYRWNGHSRHRHPLSVAQHCLLVLRLIEQRGRLAPREGLRALLHDGEEGLLGFDCITPLKPILGDAFTRLTAKLTDAITIRYALAGAIPEERKRLKAADREAAALEAMHVVGWSNDQIRVVLGLEVPSTPPSTEIERLLDPQPSNMAELEWLAALHDHRLP